VCSSDLKAVGEKTPDYLWTHGEGVEDHLPDVHENIHRALPDAKLIAVLRNPVDRAISAVKHVLRSGRISPIHSLDDLLMGASRHLLAGYGILEYGLYFRQLEAYREFFAPEQMMVLVLEEDILETPERTLFEVCRFLEIDPDFCESDPGFEIREKANENTSSRAGLLLSYYLPPLRRLVGRVDRRLPGRLAGPSRATRRSLCEYYREENEKLFELLGRRIASW
jgi:hypothetical protein